MGPAHGGATVEEPTAARAACGAEAGEGGMSERARGVEASVIEPRMEVGEDGGAGGDRPVAPEANEVEDAGGATANNEYPAASTAAAEENAGSVPGAARDSAPVASEANMEGGDGGVVNQGPATPGGRYIGCGAGGTTGVYGVVFEDGRGEDLGLPQLQDFLMSDEDGGLGMEVSCRKRKLDRLASSGSASEVQEPAGARRRSGSGSSDFTKGEPPEPCPPVQAVELPPSSGDIPVPEESICHLFSVYSFLRSFSVQLFLSPFGLDDFVAAISCTVQNNLLDAVHVSLLQALRRHLQSKSAEGSQLASNCLKHLDWTLLDTLTWPNFLLEYLYVMGCIKNLGGRSFGRSLLATEYYELPVVMKFRVLQVLCDHVIESEKLKTELECREGYNVEMEYEMDSSNLLEVGSRTVSTRASKASAHKRTNDLQNLESAPIITNPEAAVADISQDGNSDDCRICGMDGTLVCCYGCPWAYHSRCIGQHKAFLPQRAWFCPECVVNKLGPTSSRIMCGARGAQMFGTDMFGRLFLGTCNYLLVIETSSDAESHARYYNHHDGIEVLRRLALSDAYVDICKQIKEYWNDLLGIVQSERSEAGKEIGVSHTQRSSTLSFTPTKSDGGESKTVALPETNVQQKFGATVCSARHLEEQKFMYSFDAAIEKNAEVCKQTLSAQDYIQNAPRDGDSGPSVVSSISHQNGSVITGVSKIAQAQPTRSIFRSDLSMASVKAESFCPSYHGKTHLHMFAARPGNMSAGKAAKFSSFKPQAYINLYNHGNIAASAAANLAVITSDEGKVSGSQLTTNSRKKTAAENALQLKAFSSEAAQFVWPSTEKKLMEVPRVRCGWCLACKSSASGNKKACFLNVATSNAAIGSARIFSSMHVIKNSDSHFPSIVAYLANMEESLRGLLVGSLQDMQQKQRWHEQLQGASNCRTVIPLLLELEHSIRGVTFSASWLKPIDDSLVDPGLTAGGSRPAPLQKRGAGGRRGRKRLLASEFGTATDDDRSWTCWTGGSISKRTLQRGALLCSTIRKAGRQSGKRRITGLSYHEDSKFPRRSRQFVWRSCVGLCQTSSQLALQVRYLDAHIRWKEFIPPDQIPSDGKSSDADFAAIRNAMFCDKKIIDNKIRYALKFPSQKHLPVYVRKIVLEAEGDQDENGKLWFSENHVPLYLLREFEQKTGISSLPTPGILDSNCFSNFYTRGVKVFTRDIFSYLFHKGDAYPCTSCKKDVLYWEIFECNSCQRNCHKECTSRSVVSKGGCATSNLICKLCLQKRNLMLTSYSTSASYIQPQQKSIDQQPVIAPKFVFKVGSSHPTEPALKVEAQTVTKVKPQPFAKVESQPIMKGKTQPIQNVKSHPILKIEAQPLAKVEDLQIKNMATQNITSVQSQVKIKDKKSKPEKSKKPKKPLAKVEDFQITNMETQNITNVQSQPKTKAKKSKAEKSKKLKKVQEFTYFGLVWKKKENDKDDGSDFRVTDIIRSKDGIGSSVRPTCCLCAKTYSSDCLYVRCEKCGNWFHGDALQLDEERIGELVAFRCCRCLRKAIPQCPHSDDYTNPEPDFSEQTIATLSPSTMLSSEEIFALADLDPLLASYGVVELIGEETVDTDLSMKMASFYMQDQPPGNGNINFSHMNEISFSEADTVNASELLRWYFPQGIAYAAPPGSTANHQLNDASCGSFAMDEYGPQTYFSFAELIGADNTQLDNAFGMSTGLQIDGTSTGKFVKQPVGFDEMSFMLEDGASNMNFPTNGPIPGEAACDKCMNTRPPPDLKCVVCDLHIHRQCSPWDQGVETVESSNWSCGICREW
ncbi:hypothetical protein BS78_08G022400 [Paspalum vaginatum]|nr:hypothetical protein BS78_08G022400 [Paspalum vaginatum]